MKSHIWVYLFWLVSPFLKTTGILQASPSENIVLDKEHLYTATSYCNKEENLRLFWKIGVLDLYPFQ